MKLTEKIKKHIDGMSYTTMLGKLRFAPLGDTLFQGETGEYFHKRMDELRSQPGGQEMHVAASKKLGWR